LSATLPLTPTLPDKSTADWLVTLTDGAVLSRLCQRIRCAWTSSSPLPFSSAMEVSMAAAASLSAAPPHPARASTATACATKIVDGFSSKII
jgi:hypothetical protein